MKLVFEEYQARKIVNVHRHVDSWFWDKYTASPYVGCRAGCEFCYARGGRYCGNRDPDRYDTNIRVKTNAAELLRKDLRRKARDVLVCGDWQQPAERVYRLSRRMLEVVLDLSFPLLVIERSPMVTQDLDLLMDINEGSWAGAIFSISNLDPSLKRAFEPRSPGVAGRLRAMECLAIAGMTVGTALMPLIPIVGDNEDHLDAVVRATKDHGGSFVLVGGLTMDGAQADRTLAAVSRMDPSAIAKFRSLYRWSTTGKPTYGPPPAYSARLASTVRNLCNRYGLLDRMPRPVAPSHLATNKRIAEWLFGRAYDLELEQANRQRIRAYHMAAISVDEWPENLAEVYERRSLKGLQGLPGIGERLAGAIGGWLHNHQSECSPQ